MTKSQLIEKLQARGVKVVSRDTIETLRNKLIEDHLKNPNEDVLDTMKRKYKRAYAYMRKANAHKNRADAHKSVRYFKRVLVIAKNNFGRYANQVLDLHGMSVAMEQAA